MIKFLQDFRKTIEFSTFTFETFDNDLNKIGWNRNGKILLKVDDWNKGGAKNSLFFIQIYKLWNKLVNLTLTYYYNPLVT